MFSTINKAKKAVQSTLSPEDVEKCRKAFAIYDGNGSGTIDSRELRATLVALGQTPTEEEIFTMMTLVDEDGSGEIEFSEFIRVIEKQKADAMSSQYDSDTLEAFVALGGNQDGSGCVSITKFKEVVQDFGLHVPIDAMMSQLDKDASGTVDFKEFQTLLE